MITFDAAKLTTDLKKALTLTLIKLQAEVLADAEGKMFTAEGRADIEAMPVSDVAGIITAIITEGPWAILDEFGRGSEMQQDNPFLAQYRGSNLWNPERSDLAIRGRPAGSQPTMFGERVFKGNAAGRNLEELAQKGVIDKKYLPSPPSKALQTAMRWMAVGRFQEVIAETLKAFPWGAYLIAKP